MKSYTLGKVDAAEAGMVMEKEKKVEYIELIYDLIFVYLIGRNASLLDRIEAGFISYTTFLDFFVSSVIVLQIWHDTTLFINRFGKNGLGDKVMMLINMFLLYIMGANTIHGWNANYPAYMGAWSLILINIALQYLLKLREIGNEECKSSVFAIVCIFLLQAAFIGASIVFYQKTGTAVGQWSFIIGFLSVPFFEKIPTDFAHLSERVMLYVVFTFGDMLLIVAEFFSGGFAFNSFYFALTTFLTVAGLFFSYGYVYDNLLDRHGNRSGSFYMLVHILIIFSLLCITASLEFIRDDGVRSMPKILMMVVSLLMFFLGLALTEHWSKHTYKFGAKFLVMLSMQFAVFGAMMVLTEGHSGYLTAGIILVFVYVQLFTIASADKHTHERKQSHTG